MSTIDREAVKIKIAKLMALGTHASANENEAESALRQASALMRKHAIEQSELADATGAAQVFNWSTISVPLDPFKPQKTTVTWLGCLALAIARFTDCVVRYKRIEAHGMCLEFSGEAVDVGYAVYLTKHLRDTVRRMSAESRDMITRSDREEYRRGMVATLTARMEALKAEAVVEMKASGNALVVVDRKIAERDTQFGKQTVKTTSSSAGGYARAAGQRDGRDVGFGRPVGNRSAGVQRAIGRG